ncbi:MAG: transposase [Candidatus Paceibacterota bacterium]|jgi:putative transposase|nr:transposase [Candidatus Paceibacterota bacterium]
MKRHFAFAPDEYYHVYNRGTERRVIFEDDHDYKRFLVLLYLSNGTAAIDLNEYFSQEGRSFLELFRANRGSQIVDVGSYCLMPNHFHLLLREKVDGGVSTFMKKLGTAYSTYFNKKNTRVGPLFQGRFKAQHVDIDNYLKYLFSYIHLNPVKLIDPKWKEKGIFDMKKTKEYLNEYPYSSYQNFLGRKQIEKVILTRNRFPEYFKTTHDFEEFINDWLTFDDEFDVRRPSGKRKRL